jgi:phosphatidylglycerol:prolipoprotein diacylglycerol transferase
MGSFPIVWHLGPLTVYAYGVGIAVSFLFGAAYLAHRLERRGEPAEWVWSILPWVLLAAIAGARLASVLANAGAYASDPLSAVDFLHGGLAGLSSFGGIAAAVPTALWLVHRRAPRLGLLGGLDLATPVLVASWALARLVACQFMEAGGGPRTNAWYGLAYAGQAGRRIPVPLYQSAENWIIFALLLALERWRDARGGPRGLVLAIGAGLWGLSRASDEWLFFFHPAHTGALATAASGLALFAVGVALGTWLLVHRPSERLVSGAGPAS